MGEDERVNIGNLRVAISEDGGRWFAQGLEIDYAADGTSLEDVKTRFERGLDLTIGEHIRRFRNIDHLLVGAPPESWRDALVGAMVGRYTCLSVHKVKFSSAMPEGVVFPFENIAYLGEKRAA